MRSCENDKKFIFGHLSNKYNTNIVDMMCSCKTTKNLHLGILATNLINT